MVVVEMEYYGNVVFEMVIFGVIVVVVFVFFGLVIFLYKNVVNCYLVKVEVWVVRYGKDGYEVGYGY